MTPARKHEPHPHVHADGCGHKGILHQGHVCYLHDGCLHHPLAGRHEEHAIAVGPKNPDACTPKHSCGGHGAHQHVQGCGHDRVPHGDHVCYLVDGHLHFPHGDHCDDHGEVELA